MLGEIKKVQLRKIWKNEAYDFTPWLADNIEQIGEAIGLELEFEDKEVSVGPYSADILAKDAGTDKFVVIENQLEKTNHDHLGKCITYASVLDASAVIWIASKFTDEHKKALDWLNDHTSDEIGFYGIKVELWQIDNSQPAVRFNVVSEPNAVVRQATKRKEQGELTDTRKTQLEFWTAFREKLVETGKVRSLQTPRPQYWFDVALGKSGINLSNTFNTDKNEIGVRVYIGNKKADEWLPYFESKKEIIETQIGSELVWNPNPENRDKVITLTKHFDLENKENWKIGIDWLAEHTIKFRETFSRIIKEKTA
ncbi:DUF4268 domain-containing protein [Joostella sp. CR20]|uniref:DUF4268 domain-containing protein n=1 Tax=Joostella sp. CR20 TaxID=2804312 RepID=UPI00313E0083